MDIVLAAVDGGVLMTSPAAHAQQPNGTVVSWDQLPGVVVEQERRFHRVDPHRRQAPRWIWANTQVIYPRLLAADVRVERCFDLRLCHAILRNAASAQGSTLASSPESVWDVPVLLAVDDNPTLLDETEAASDVTPDQVLEEYRRQCEAVTEAADPGRLRLLLAAESAGALIAAEMKYWGLPWSRTVHDQQLTRLLGPRPLPGGRPAKLEALAVRIRSLLAAPALNPDSPAELLRALRAVGMEAATTRQWELERLEHPAIGPLLEYKKLARLLTANGWAWMDAWVRDGRFHPDYVPGGVVTGRWATRGGGALQLPKQTRAAVRADPGCQLVVADAAQLEPRVLAAMSRDEKMAEASRGLDLYQGLVDAGIVDSRAHAKMAMLGALYGATSGEAGQLMPRLMRAYQKATTFVEQAARVGERGEVVSTWLGRSCPPPAESWQTVQRRASEEGSTVADQRNAGRQSRDWGRFTRNFVVQGSAAEWALCWMANLRNRLTVLSPASGTHGSMPGPQLVYFLHDEVIVHTPAALAEQVEEAIRESADDAGRLLFGSFPVEFALNIAIVDNYAQAK